MLEGIVLRAFESLFRLPGKLLKRCYRGMCLKSFTLLSRQSNRRGLSGEWVASQLISKKRRPNGELLGSCEIVLTQQNQNSWGVYALSDPGHQILLPEGGDGRSVASVALAAYQAAKFILFREKRLIVAFADVLRKTDAFAKQVLVSSLILMFIFSWLSSHGHSQEPMDGSGMILQGVFYFFIFTFFLSLAITILTICLVPFAPFFVANGIVAEARHLMRIEHLLNEQELQMAGQLLGWLGPWMAFPVEY